MYIAPFFLLKLKSYFTEDKNSVRCDSGLNQTSYASKTYFQYSYHSQRYVVCRAEQSNKKLFFVITFVLYLVITKCGSENQARGVRVTDGGYNGETDNLTKNITYGR